MRILSSAKLFASLAFLAIIVATSININSAHALSGSGTSTNPYQITTAAELQNLNNYLGSSYSSTYFKLMNNIDLNVAPYNSGTGWTPIGNNTNPFYGHFDGNYQTITGLYIDNPTTSYQGLFGEIAGGSTVKDITLSNVNVNAYEYSGSLVGWNYGGVVDNAGVSSGSVTGGMRSGGLVGSNSYGSSMARDYASVSYTYNAVGTACCGGGLTGETAFGSSTITDSYSTSSVYISTGNTSQGSVAGVLGNDYSSGSISNLYYAGAISYSGSTPYELGTVDGAGYNTSVASSYWDNDISGVTTSGGGSGVHSETTSAMKIQATYSGWDFTNTWAISPTVNNGYPYLQWQDLTPTVTVPDTPTGLTITPGDGSASLSWTTPANDGGMSITDFSIEYRIDGASSWTTYSHTVSTSTTATITGLTNGNEYNFRLAAVNGIGTGAYETSNPTLIATNPNKPTDLNASTKSNSVSMSWTAPSSNGGSAITDYKLYWRVHGSGAWSAAVSLGTNLTYNLTGLTSGNYYDFKITAVNAIGESPADEIDNILYYYNVPSSNGGSSTSKSNGAAATITTSEVADNKNNTSYSSNIVLNEYGSYTSGSGKELNLTENQIVHFTINDNGVTEHHTATIKQISGNYVVVTIASHPFNVYIGIGETQTISLDGKGVMTIKLDSITNGKAKLVFKKLHDNTVSFIQNASAAPHETSKSNTVVWATAVALALIVGIIIGRMSKESKKTTTRQL